MRLPIAHYDKEHWTTRLTGIYWRFLLSECYPKTNLAYRLLSGVVECDLALLLHNPCS